MPAESQHSLASALIDERSIFGQQLTIAAAAADESAASAAPARSSPLPSPPVRSIGMSRCSCRRQTRLDLSQVAMLRGTSEYPLAPSHCHALPR